MIEYTKFAKNNYKDCLIVVDSVVSRLYDIADSNCLVLDSGEQCKSFAVLDNIISWLYSHKANKTSKVVAIGGGTIGDVVGLACSLYMRGISIIHVPTTLLAMVDSSIGGKTGINYGQVKNLVGSFHTGDCIIDSSFVKTLPQCQLDIGKGEIYKYMLLDQQISDSYLLPLDELIPLCSQFKYSIVNQDYHDNNIRQCLNMGHTIGHALELRYHLAHGQAVTLGLYYELQLALALSLVDQQYIDSWLSKVQLPSLVNIDQLTLDNLVFDKKNNLTHKIAFSLPCNSYKWQSVNLTIQQIKEMLNITC